MFNFNVKLLHLIIFSKSKVQILFCTNPFLQTTTTANFMPDYGFCSLSGHIANKYENTVHVALTLLNIQTK